MSHLVLETLTLSSYSRKFLYGPLRLHVVLKFGSTTITLVKLVSTRASSKSDRHVLDLGG